MVDATLPAQTVDEAVNARQPLEMRGSNIWSEAGFACSLIGRYLRFDPWIGGLLTFATVAAAIASGIVSVQVTLIAARTLDALVARDAAAAWYQILLGVAVAVASVLINGVTWASTYTLQIRWRRAITMPLIDRWMTGRRYHSLAFGGEIDNPEQRIQEDASLIVERGINLVTFFLSIMSSTIPYLALLWGLSGVVSLRSWGLPLDFYGGFVWAAILWGIAWTWIIHKIGRPYQRVEVTRQHLEADFRRAMARVRESSEAIAFERGDENERQRTHARFGLIVSNWFWVGFYGTRMLVTQSFEGLIGGTLSTLLAAPAVLAGTMTVGQLSIVGTAFYQVRSGTTWFVGYYKSIAEWLASSQRIRLLETRLARPLEPAGERVPTNDGSIALRDVVVDHPDGETMLAVDEVEIRPGERLLLRGRSGSGKSTLLRVIAGLWPYASGRIDLPDDRRIMYLPQRSYMPEGSLRMALVYPQPEFTYDDAAVREAMDAVGLQRFTGRLDELSDWGRRLSGGEQQRVAAVRALVQAPDVLFLDEATSALDAGLEARLYGALIARIPDAIIVSVAHRSSVAEFHHNSLVVSGGKLRRDGLDQRENKV